MLYKLYPTTDGLNARLKYQRQLNYLLYLNTSKTNVRNFNLLNSPALFTADNIRPPTEKGNTSGVFAAIPLLLFVHLLPAVAVAFWAHCWKRFRHCQATEQ